MPVMQSPPGAVTQIDGREYLYFVGTGYLGLQGHAEVIAPLRGRPAVRHRQRELAHRLRHDAARAGSRTPAAKLFGLDDAFYFASGWMGNNVLMQLLDGQSGLMLIDEYSHYSVFEAALLRAADIAAT